MAVSNLTNEVVAVSTEILPLPMWTNAVAPTFNALCLHPPMDANPTTATKTTLILPLPVLTNPTTATKTTLILPLAMWALLADPHIAETVHRRCC